MYLPSTEKKVESLTGKHRIRGIYDQENFLNYLVHEFQIQNTMGNQNKPNKFFALPWARHISRGSKVKLHNAQEPSALLWRLVHYSSENRAEQE